MFTLSLKHRPVNPDINEDDKQIGPVQYVSENWYQYAGSSSD